MELIDWALDYQPNGLRPALNDLCVIRGASGVGKSTLAARLAKILPRAFWIDADVLDNSSTESVGQISDKLVSVYRLALIRSHGPRLVIYSGFTRSDDHRQAQLHLRFRSVRVITLHLPDIEFTKRYLGRAKFRGWRTDDLDHQAEVNRHVVNFTDNSYHFALNASAAVDELTQLALTFIRST